MKLELYVQNSQTGKTYDISELAEPVQVYKSINGSAGKLTCILQKDPNDVLNISNGSRISFIVDGKGMFFGYIFSIGTDADGNYKITAYDQMRYLKNSDVMKFTGITASDIFANICQIYNLKYSIKSPTRYIPPDYPFQEQSLYAIIEKGMNLASINDKKIYFLIDDFGTLTWSEVSAEGSAITIDLNEYSGVTSFTYETSIDKDTFNQIKLYRENKEAGKIDSWVVKDTTHIKHWGILQFLKNVDDNLNSAQVRELAEKYLIQKNRETQTLKLQGEGINECIAGQRIHFKLPSENIDKYMYIISSTHTYSKYEHTMDLEVYV